MSKQSRQADAIYIIKRFIIHILKRNLTWRDVPAACVPYVVLGFDQNNLSRYVPAWARKAYHEKFKPKVEEPVVEAETVVEEK